ncbi:scavenger receptor [Mactra antiquata]
MRQPIIAIGSQVRLAGGITSSSGRVEVTKDGITWGTVCDDEFDVNDAKVICRMLGFTDTEYAQVESPDRYGRGSGEIMLDDTNCQGNESDVFHCYYSTDADCDHTEDVGVSCQTPLRLNGNARHIGMVEIKEAMNDSWSPVCFDSIDDRAGKVICQMLGLSIGKIHLTNATIENNLISTIGKKWTCNGTETDLQSCVSSVHECSLGEAAFLECSTRIRLQDGPNNQTGRVEVYHNGQWGTVCDDSFDDKAASVVCSMLGFNPRQARAIDGVAFGEGLGDIVIDDIRCTGLESDIADCKSRIWGSVNNCHHTEDAAVECGTLIKLTDGPMEWAGRLEVKSNGSWKSVCDLTFDDAAASVACRMLGFHGGTPRVRKQAYYGQGTGQHFEFRRNCYGNETDFIRCSQAEGYPPCNHGDDIGVNCFSETPARLNGGWNTWSGRIEVYDRNKGVWKGVCNEKYGFTQNDAKVLCRMLGFTIETPRIIDGNHYDYVIRGEGMAHLNCTGEEIDISDCRSSQLLRESTCEYPGYIGINCDPDTPIRLVDGPSRHAGRVEILYNDTWIGICPSKDTDNNKKIICEMVHPTYKEAEYLSGYQNMAGDDDVIMNNLDCAGNEKDISDCRVTPLTIGQCSRTNAEAVVCGSDVKLVNGSNDRSGIVTVHVDGDWRTICAKHFDNNAADVVCRTAGFHMWNASFLTGVVSSSVPYINHINCTGNERHLAMCKSEPWNATSCEDDLVATVNCDIYHTTMRLVNGENPYSGRIEVFYDGEWGTVCENRFDINNAEVVCRTLGYNFSTDVTVHIDDYDGSYGSKPLMIRDMSCEGNELDVSLCKSEDWKSGTSGCPAGYRSVGVNCLTEIRLVGVDNYKYMGYVEVKHRNSWGSICGKNFDLSNVAVLCSKMGFNFTSDYQLIENTYYSNSYVPRPIIENLRCSGNEIDIQECQSSTWGYVDNCTNQDAAVISCHTPVRLTNGSTLTGEVEVYQNGGWWPVLYQSTLSINTGKVICRMLGLSSWSVKDYEVSRVSSSCLNVTCIGTEVDLSKCSSKIRTSDCNGKTYLGIECDTGIKLFNGRTPYMGEVTVFLKDSWGFIKTIQNEDAAKVVCRSLGFLFTNESVLAQRSSDFRSTSGCKRIYVEELICDGNETDVMKCTESYMNFGRYSGCHYVYEGVNCQTPVRLSESFYQHGQVEFRHNGSWIPMCSKTFDLEEAHVVCRMLGHYHVKNTTTIRYSNTSGEFMQGSFYCNGSEVDISECTEDWQTSRCIGGSGVYVDCRSTIRLVDGDTKFHGRVEVFYEGKWGPVCRSSSSNNAKAICRALGYNFESATAMYGTKYSNNTFNESDFVITNLNCVGTEHDITECQSDLWNTTPCTYPQPLEIECKTYVDISYNTNIYTGYVHGNYNGTSWSICGDNFTEADATVICKNSGRETNQTAVFYEGNRFGGGYRFVLANLGCSGSEKDLQECLSPPWVSSYATCNKSNTAVSVNCRPNTPIRLVGGNSSGVVEINYDNRWGTICFYNFDLRDASVVCNMLGYKVGEVGERYNTGTAIIRNLYCKGTERDISECSAGDYWSYGRVCNVYENRVASVTCSNDRVRLTDGVNDYTGRVEFQYIGVWGTICDTHFDANDVEVVCRQIGFSHVNNAKTYNATKYSHYSTTLVVDDLKCQGRESDLDECGSFPWSENQKSCSYNNIGAGVNCRPNTPIRLVNGTNRYSGRVEIEYKESYGTICDREFDLNDARVICRNLAYNPWSASFERHAYSGPGSGDIHISHLQCNGDEPDISECGATYRWGNPYAYCNHGQDVSVQCDTPVRLHGGWTDFNGQVEVYVNETWMPVCIEHFAQSDAEAICNMKTHSLDADGQSSVIFRGSTYYNMKNTGYNIGISNFKCNGNEDDLFACSSEWLTETFTNCSPVGINCRSVTPLRLLYDNGTEMDRPKGKVNMTGWVEIKYKNTWGSICNDQFGDEDALVLCRMLNFTVGKVVKTDTESIQNERPSKGPILIDDVRCLGDENDISECLAREWGHHDCEHEEDIKISCDYEDNIDPCSPKHHTLLPNLELRYANVDTTKLPRAINDSGLPLQWYKVGNNTLPNKAPSPDHCGTHIPLYSTEPLPEGGKVSVVKISATGSSDILLQAQVKYCRNPGSPEGEYYVYRLGPTYNENMGYCFGEGLDVAAPTFVPDSVKISENKEHASFVCKFTPPKEPLYYQVKWNIEGNSQPPISKQYFNDTQLDKLELTDKDFDDYSIGLGVNLTCSVRAFKQPYGQPGTLSSPSKPHFVGLRIITPIVSLQNGETKSIELEMAFPMVCVDQDHPLFCTLNLKYHSPDGNTCAGGVNFREGCGTTVKPDQQFIQVNISAADTGQFAVGGHFKVFIDADADENIKLLNQKYKLPAIDVNVLPERNQESRKKVCSARNDPHMHTFDGVQYEHHESIGEYILYKHSAYNNIEVQHKISHCTDPSNKAKCNCGVAVRAGRDVYVINVCDNFLDIGYRQCGDNALTVKKDNDFTYTVYLPYGTGIKVRIDNAPFQGKEGGKIVDVSVLPSVYDQDGNSTGLCGRLNDNPDDDFHDRNLAQVTNATQFINSWTVEIGASLFSRDVDQRRLEGWVFPTCVCNYDTNDGNQFHPLSCNRNVSTCSPGITTGQHSCGDLSPRRSTRSLHHKLSRIPIVMQTDHYRVQRKLKKREVSAESFTNESATAYCKDYFKQLKAYELCTKVPATHTNISVDNCILDLLLTGDTAWIKISQQSMQDACITQIHRNASVRQDILVKAKNTSEHMDTGSHIVATVAPADVKEIEDIERTITEIKELACLNNCSGHGRCLNGTCKCENDYGASDCSLDIKKPPRLVGVLDQGHCDEANYDCTHIYVFGEVFVGTNLTCRLQKFKMGVNATSRKQSGHDDIQGVADTLVEAMCPVSQLIHREKRSTEESDSTPPDDFVNGYNVKISNDGINFSNESFDVFVYDSSCQFFQNDSVNGVSFSLDSGFCHIDGKCVANGTLHTSQTLTCDIRQSQFTWTAIPTTTVPTSTTHVSTSSKSPDSCGCNKEHTKSCLNDTCICNDEWTGHKCDVDFDECKNNIDICKGHPHTGCQNEPGTHKCLCLRGFHTQNESCIAAAKNASTELLDLLKSNSAVQAFQVEITLDYDNGGGFNLELEKTYSDVKKALKDYYITKIGNIGLKDVVILSLRHGSLIIDHTVVIETAEYVMTNLAIAVAEMSHGGKLKLFGKNYSINNVQFDKGSGQGTESKYYNFLLCESYIKLQPCDEDQTCSVVDGKPTCRKADAIDKKPERQLMIIIGSSVGGLLLFIIIILAYCVHNNKKKVKKYTQSTQHAQDNVYNDVNSMQMTHIPRLKVTGSGNTSFAADNSGYQNDHDASKYASNNRFLKRLPDGTYREDEDGSVYYYGKRKNNL